MSRGAFKVLSSESPELAGRLLRAPDQTLTARIRGDNERYSDTFRGVAGRA